jgi:phage gp36-like protein
VSSDQWKNGKEIFMAEAWVAITEDDLKTALTVKEREIFGMGVGGDTPTDRVPGILSDVTALVRSYIASCERNVMDVDSTLIPRMALHHALAIARWRVLTALPKYVPGDARKEEYERAIAFCEELAKCKIMPPRPLNPETMPGTPQTSNSPRVNGRPRRYGLGDQDGI